MPEAVIVATARSPIGRAYKGSLIEVRADLAGFAIDALMSKVPEVDQRLGRRCDGRLRPHPSRAGVQRGAAGFTAGRDAGECPGDHSQSILRLVVADDPHGLPCHRAGEGDTYVAGGVDSVTRTYGKGFDSEDLNPRFTDETRDDFIDQVYIPMGNTAENVAERYGITREHG